MPVNTKITSQLRDTTLLKRILAYFKPYWRYILLSLVCLIVVALTTGATAWLIQPAMDEIFIEKNASALIFIPFAYFLITLIKGVARYGQGMTVTYVGLNVLRTIRTQLFEKMLRLPMAYFDKSQVGMLMSHITNDVGMMQRSLPACLMLMRQSLTMLALLVVVFYQNAFLAMWAVLVLPVAGLPLVYFNKRLRRYSRRAAELNASFTSLLQEFLSGIRVIKAFATEKETAESFNNESLRLQRLSLHQSMVGEFASPTMELVAALGIGLIIWFGGSQVIEDVMTAGEFFSFVAALLMMYDPFKSFNNAMLDMQNALAGAERVFTLLDSPEYAIEKGGDNTHTSPLTSLSFENVTFSYAPENPDESPALNNISFSIRNGERIALVGPSGAGKSTLINLIPRFHIPQKGRILWNGEDISSYSLQELRRSIAIVSQDVFLFNTSAADNICYGLCPEDKTEDRLHKAAHAANAHSFINALPEGYSTLLGERGTRLSGGQKQRLAIARALIKDSPLLILDEATSALDSESEKEVQNALDNLMEGRTSLVIAHRLSTVLGADRIMVMDHGRIVDIGHHTELLHRCPLYTRLYELQFGLEEEKKGELGEGAPLL